ncbi:hypothetical protein MBCUT_17180 [Methanobrevibacter cuticularis]|uniref:N-acetyltransferase domain-containing protein n=1 Tax=Methanobrevibacter cuticularis TaxID=47311 RepID=A0A166D1S2_9EURY|nr:GNAT family N-acetyltransferase [Methanobrevibacter cuticularis]KZX15116.1 hypothetical protein MBCUT_17180 [Methanobrevibacter cuticularis]
MRIDHIDDDTQKSIKNQLPEIKEIPSIKIGRFAICEEYSKQGIGSNVMGQLILEILSLSQKVGLRFIIVEAYAVAYHFYIKNNFISLKKDSANLKKLNKNIEKDPERTFTLYQDINKLR